MIEALSEPKWLQINSKILLLFCIITIILTKTILCENDHLNSKLFFDFVKQNSTENVNKNNLSSIHQLLLFNKLSNTTNVTARTLNPKLTNIRKINDDIDNNEIMENVSPYVFLRTKRLTSERNGMSENIQHTTTTTNNNKIFNVLIKRKLKSNEFVGLTGNISELGNWDPDNAIELNRSDIITATDDNDEIWTTNINFSEQYTNLEYRYFIGEKNFKTDDISIAEWENNFEPRKYTQSIHDLNNDNHSDLDSIRDIDAFGEINGDTSIDFGWLEPHETIVQLQFFRNSFNIKNNNLDQYRIKLIPIDSNTESAQIINIKYSKLKYNDSELKEQPSDGVIYNVDDMLIFHIRLSDKLNNVEFLLNIYDVSTAESKDNQLIGYEQIDSDDLENSEGEIKFNLLEDVGYVNILYLIIKPLKSINFSFRTSFSNYWDSNWPALDVGHRGLGASFKIPENEKPPVIENTVTSMLAAGAAAADMVEFDVHLTKDLIPIIYHDFTIYVRDDPQKPPEISNLVRVHLQDLTYEELKSTTMYYVNPDGNINEYKAHNDESNINDRLFPTLEEFFEKIDPSVGFDIEIKWPQRIINGQMEANQSLDKNLFADRILQIILEKGSGRFSFLSTFDADLCTMLKFKQNMYPVMFLTMGTLHHWTSFYDPRCETAENTIANAKTWNLFGIVAHSRDYFNDPSLINLSFKMNQRIFCWGSDINSTSAVEQMKNIGMNGVIYDRVDKFTSAKRKSIFKNDESEQLFKHQHL